jgi:predicted nucleic-acid-binding Zn-ribbon protein
MGKLLRPLTQEEVQAKVDEAVRVLGGRRALFACPRCGQNDWHGDLVGYVVQGLPATGSFNIPPPHLDFLNLTCKNCGSTQLHNLRVLGIDL